MDVIVLFRSIAVGPIIPAIRGPFDARLSFAATLLIRSRIQEHWEEAGLPLQFDNIIDSNRIGLPSLAANRSDYLQIRVINDSGVDVVGVRWSDVVNALVEIHDGDSIAGLGHETWNVTQKLVLGRCPTAIIKEVEHPVMSGIVGQHMETRTPKMRLEAGVVMKDVVVHLPRAIGVREVDQPVPPAARIVN